MALRQTYTVEHVDLQEPIWWDSFNDENGTVFSSSAWLAALERTSPQRAQPFHFRVVNSDGQTVALCPLFLIEQCPRFDAFIQQFRPSKEWNPYPILVSQGLYSFAGGPISVTNSRNLWIVLIEHVENIAKEVGARVWGMTNVPLPIIGPHRDFLVERGYDVGYLSSDMQLDIAAFETFSDYRNTLSRHMRRNINYFDNKRLRQDIRLHWTEDPGSTVTTLNLLLRQTTGKHQHGSDLYPMEFLMDIIDRMGPSLACLVVSREDTVLGILLAFFSTRTVIPWAIGLDYSLLKTYNTYHVALLETIRESIVRGAQTVQFGRGSYIVKQRYGARPVPLFMALGGIEADRLMRQEWFANLSSSKVQGIVAQLGSIPDLPQ